MKILLVQIELFDRLLIRVERIQILNHAQVAEAR